ncbi:MAG: hypothetical protein MUC55_04305 [Burkholderiales bacterium]|jgi:hypothetical protein|nr:hypothetical protein [Burkholderiales bacterium]
MISYRDTDSSQPAIFRPVARAVLTLAAVAIGAYAVASVIDSASALVAPASMSVAGFEPSRVGFGGTERTAGDLAVRPIDYLPARLTVSASAEDPPQPETF